MIYTIVNGETLKLGDVTINLLSEAVSFLQSEFGIDVSYFNDDFIIPHLFIVVSYLKDINFELFIEDEDKEVMDELMHLKEILQT